MTGCATPTQNFLTTALDFGFQEQKLLGQPFTHKIYANPSAYQAKLTTLHVYLDGDGTPWKHGRIANDPTSRNPIILKLMAQDKQAAILLGRPCYHGLSQSLNCQPSFWTSKRYSQTVVNSMGAVLERWLAQYPAKEIILIGYSGGGTLAVLMAEKLKRVKAILTFAANLDVKAWSFHHGYPPLSESLNPVDYQPLSNTIKQLHLAGGEDDNVPAFVIQNYVKKQHKAVFKLYQEFNHYCCWEEQWQQILIEIK